MPLLFENLKQSASDWRRNGYACDDYPLIGEILAWQTQQPETDPVLRFLREPQFLALEVYWYVRLVLKTPHIIDLYRHYYADSEAGFLDALGVPLSRDALKYADVEKIIEDIKTDMDFVTGKKIQALHEAVILDYPSYILALAMGAGKTVLIGSIMATEFAMSLHYPDPDGRVRFMKNALVFAPGTTIVESLRELSAMLYEKVLPPDLHRDFAANLKITFPGRGKGIQVQNGSRYNLIITNTEKINLRARRRKNQQAEAFERDEVEANARLQTIASLPDIGIFSDEAHHTYGNTFDRLKRVRQTINYIHENTPVVAVINTTGTPYYRRQPLREVIVWYGLGDGISDNILKSLNNGVHQYDLEEQQEQEVFRDIIREFFSTYDRVSLANGARAKIAFYFKTQAHLQSARLLIEEAMAEIGQDAAQILVNTQRSGPSELDEFKRLNNPGSRKRVILLIGKGVEGWNCPSLFACALIKEQTRSNNYVLQASTRCLRQVAGNRLPAKVFLDYRNAKILDRELQENFGTSLAVLGDKEREKETITLRILKTELPKLEINHTVRRVVRTDNPQGAISLHKPKAKPPPGVLRSILNPDFTGSQEILMATGETTELPVAKKLTDCHTAAWKIASRYHVPIMPVLHMLQNLYPKGTLPDSHLYGLFSQVEKQLANYGISEEAVREVLALIKVQDQDGRDLFEKNEEGVHVHRLRLLKRTLARMREQGLLAENGDDADRHDLSFHYSPYHFDSGPERSLFQQVLSALNTDPDDISAFLFTGGLTDPKKTDFHFEYLGEDRRYHRYFPDFVLVKKTGEFYIIEVKSASDRGDATVQAKRKAIEKLQAMQPDKFRYHIVYTSKAAVGAGEVKPVMDWVRDEKC